MPSSFGEKPTRVAAVLLAGGSGRRMKGEADDKVLLSLGGVPLILHSFRAFASVSAIDSIVFVYRDPEQQTAIAEILPPHSLQILWAKGGKERQDSVLAGLQALPADTEAVLIHDCARPFVSPDAIEKSIALALTGQVACLASPVVDTIKQVNTTNEGTVPHTLERSRLWAMATPQSFPFALIRDAYQQINESDRAITDDLSAVETQDIPVHFIDNGGPNPKLTTPDDIPYLEFLLARSTIRK